MTSLANHEAVTVPIAKLCQWLLGRRLGDHGGGQAQAFVQVLRRSAAGTHGLCPSAGCDPWVLGARFCCLLSHVTLQALQAFAQDGGRYPQVVSLRGMRLVGARRRLR